MACEHSHSGNAHVHFAVVNVAVNGNPQNAVLYIYRNTQSKQQHFTVQNCVKQLIKLKWPHEETIRNIE